MAESGVSRDHSAKVLNHVEGGPAAARVYDRYAYDAEKRQALERWAQRLSAIIGPFGPFGLSTREKTLRG
jgi:hypothetical protein